MFFLSIDLGGTFIKSAIVNPLNLSIKDIKRTKTPEFNESGIGAKEISIDKLKLEIRKHFVERDFKGVHGILITNQMHGFVLQDRSGAIVSDYISWQDQRGNEVFLRIKKQIGSEKIKLLGGEFKPGYPVVLLKYLNEQNYHLNNLTPLSLGEWLSAELSGDKINEIHSSNLSAFGCYGLSEKNYDFDLIKSLDLNNLEWPQLISDTIITSFFREPITLKKIPVYISIGDQQTSLCGAMLSDEKTLSLNIATGSQCSIVTNQLKFGNYQIRPYFNNTLLNTQTHIPAGRSLNLLFNFFNELSGSKINSLDFAKIDEEAFKLKFTDLEVKLGFFEGAFETEGSIKNMNYNNMKYAHVYYACVENIVQNHFKASLNLSINQSYDKLLVSGGLGQKSKTLLKIAANYFEKEIIFPPSKEDTLLGLLVYAKIVFEKSNNWFDAIESIRTSNIICE